jgi:hypothetical protein
MRCALALFVCDLRAWGVTGGDLLARLTAAVAVARVGVDDDAFTVDLILARAADRL